MIDNKEKRATEAIQRMFKLYGIERTEEKLKLICKNKFNSCYYYHMKIYKQLLAGSCP